MRVLVACEFSGIVRDAFRARGHDAWSCDPLPCEKGPEFHFRTTVQQLFRNWKLLAYRPKPKSKPAKKRARRKKAKG